MQTERVGGAAEGAGRAGAVGLVLAARAVRRAVAARRRRHAGAGVAARQRARAARARVRVPCGRAIGYVREVHRLIGRRVLRVGLTAVARLVRSVRAVGTPVAAPRDRNALDRSLRVVAAALELLLRAAQDGLLLEGLPFVAGTGEGRRFFMNKTYKIYNQCLF